MAAGCSLVPLAGQGCVLPTRVYAQSAIFDEFVERVRAHAQTFTLGDPLDMATVIGPVITEAAAQRIMGVIDRGKAESGGRTVTGGTLRRASWRERWGMGWESLGVGV